MHLIKYILCGLFFVSIFLNVALYKQWDITHQRSLRFEELCQKVQNQNEELKRELK